MYMYYMNVFFKFFLDFKIGLVIKLSVRKFVNIL